MELPKIVTPKEAEAVTEEDQEQAVKLVKWVNSRLTGMEPGKAKKIIIPMGYPRKVYSLVRNHFRSAWYVEKVEDMMGDDSGREQSWHQWEMRGK